MVSEENSGLKIHTGGDANKDPLAQNTAASEREGNLMELNTPKLANDPTKKQPQDKTMQTDILDDLTNKEANLSAKPAGLGVNGVDDMKSVDI